MCAQSCLTLCDPMDCNLPGSSVHGIFQARILEWLPFPPPGDLPNPGIEPRSLTSAGGFFTTWATREAQRCVSVRLLQLCLTLCDPMDYSPLGSSVHGILQARTLEWVAMPFSRGSSGPRNWTCISPVSPISCTGRRVLYHLEKAMATHSSTLGWKIPRTEEPGRLQSMGSQRVGHDWATSLSLLYH